MGRGPAWWQEERGTPCVCQRMLRALPTLRLGMLPAPGTVAASCLPHTTLRPRGGSPGSLTSGAGLSQGVGAMPDSANTMPVALPVLPAAHKHLRSVVRYERS